MFKSEKVKKCFEENGWYEDRRVDITPYINMYREYNIVPCSLAFNILEEFGGIEVKLPTISLGKATSLIFDPCEGEVTFEELHAFEKVTNEKLIPIGFLPRSTLDIYISESSVFYFAGSYEFMYLTRVGYDFYEMLEIYFNKEYLNKDRFPNLCSY
ncbi:SUKH-3 domain-containing protein [Paenibacillus macerans]|uniref:SUKH-3 domain-containing protein n=1 Tax=Paenibacillus macerans TaxID=44252 RepID=UPI002041C27E|nr:SUKH-3 domain-containing protein [Paenibacillus macerans]MCM3700717.1 SUKH-3 domain-containing protein [Paenibacillus macerans]